jgi:hypothetical protein
LVKSSIPCAFIASEIGVHKSSESDSKEEAADISRAVDSTISSKNEESVGAVVVSGCIRFECDGVFRSNPKI